MKPILIPDLMPVTEEIASLTVGVYKVLTDALEELTGDRYGIFRSSSPLIEVQTEVKK